MSIFCRRWALTDLGLGAVELDPFHKNVQQKSSSGGRYSAHPASQLILLNVSHLLSLLHSTACLKASKLLGTLTRQ